ncbi:MAG: diacylglycerol kinase family lipid kinase [Anaerolineales bacterium]|nr:diacylglycerol kinase family lipid kinase [Anaerolineales bacterium]
MAGKRIKLIINPNADMGAAWRQAAALRPIVEQHGGADWAGTVYPTHAMELARQAGLDGYDLVVAIGGDGTVHEVINGLMQLPANKRPKFGVVPLGSGNDFAHAVGMDDRPEVALQQILTGAPRKIDLGVVEDEHGRKEYWNNTINIGFGGSVNIYSHNLPVVRGFLMYFVAVLMTIIRNYDILQMDITTDEEQWSEGMIMLAVCNGHREGGGFITAPDAKLDDGVLNYTAAGAVSRLFMFRMIPEFMRGTQGKFSQVKMGTLKRMEIQCKQPMSMHTDGEIWAGFGSNVRHLKIQILPKELEIIAPKA